MDQKTKDAMQLVILWRKMYYLCQERTSCTGCPFYHVKSDTCEKASTDAILNICASAFEEHFAMQPP